MSGNHRNQMGSPSTLTLLVNRHSQHYHSVPSIRITPKWEQFLNLPTVFTSCAHHKETKMGYAGRLIPERSLFDGGIANPPNSWTQNLKRTKRCRRREASTRGSIPQRRGSRYQSEGRVTRGASDGNCLRAVCRAGCSQEN